MATVEALVPDSAGWSAKTLIVVSAVATSLLTGVVSFVVQTWADEAARRDESAVQEVTEFVSAGEEFRGHYSSFMSELTRGQSLDESQGALLENVRVQYSLLETAKQGLSGNSFDFASDYQASLALAVRQLSGDVEMVESEPLVQNLMTILDDEVCVSFYLRSSVDLEVSPDTASKCPAP